MSSLRQLADQLNLSHATVSAALRGLPTVKAATRDRVLKAAAEIGYRANPLASALMGEMRRSRAGVFRGVVALLHLENPDPSRPDHAAQKIIATAAAARAAELGFKADVIVAGRDGYDWDRLTEILSARGISGLLVFAPSDRRRFSRIDWTRFPALQVGLADEQSSMNSVCPDYFGAMTTALNNLRALGYVRPGLVLRGDTEALLLARWKAAYTTFYLESSGSEDEARPPRPFMHVEPDAEGFKHWLRLGGYDVVLADSPAGFEWLRDLAAPGAEMQGFCCLNLLGDMPSLAGADLRLEAVGRKGVDLLTDQILRNERAGIELPTTTLCPPRWREGSSLRLRERLAV